MSWISWKCVWSESCILPGHCRALLALTSVCLGLPSPACTGPGGGHPLPQWGLSQADPWLPADRPSHGPTKALQASVLAWSQPVPQALFGLPLGCVWPWFPSLGLILTLSHRPVSCLASVHPWSQREAWCSLCAVAAPSLLQNLWSYL